MSGAIKLRQESAIQGHLKVRDIEPWRPIDVAYIKKDLPIEAICRNRHRELFLNDDSS